MKLHNLKCTNFAGMASFYIDFHPQLTILVGKNGSGKTSVLRAASIVLGTIMSKFNGVNKLVGLQGIKQDYVHRISYRLGDDIDVQEQYPVIIHAEGECENRTIVWEKVKESPSGNTKDGDRHECTQLSAEYQKRMSEGDASLLLPLISFYGTGRLWAQHKEKKEDTFSKNTRTNGYIDCLDGAANDKLMMKWFQRMAVKKANSSKMPETLLAVKKALVKCFQLISGYSHVDISFNPDTTALDFTYLDEAQKIQRIPLSLLSDGYRSTLNLISDIAYRMAILNPQLGDHILEQTDGVVLIDEIDLHLHPAWQERILEDLMAIFPRIQFIVTTHAPAVINSARSENIRLLDGNEAVEPAGEVYGKDTNMIISGVMGASERPEKVKELFRQFSQAIDNKNLMQAEDVLAQIENSIGHDDPKVASCHATLSLEKFKRKAR